MYCKECGNKLDKTSKFCAKCGRKILAEDKITKEVKNIETHTSDGHENIISIKKFLLLNLVTFGIYPVYWGWKNWEILKRIEGSSIHSGIRGFFITFTSFSLFRKILTLAKAHGYKDNYNPTLLASSFFIITFISNRFDNPDLTMYLLGSASLIILNSLILIRVVSAMNYYLKNNKEDANIFKIKPNYTLTGVLVAIFSLVTVISFFAEA